MALKLKLFSFIYSKHKKQSNIDQNLKQNYNKSTMHSQFTDSFLKIQFL